MNGWSVIFKNQVTERHMIANLMYCSHLNIDPNAHQGNEATEHLLEHKRRLQMDSETQSHEMNPCHVKVKKFHIFIYQFTSLKRKNSRLGCNMTMLEVYYSNLLFLWYH